MRAPRELSWAALLLSCAATSALTALATALALHQLRVLGDTTRAEKQEETAASADREATPQDKVAAPAEITSPPQEQHQDTEAPVETPSETVAVGPAPRPPPPPPPRTGKHVVALRGLAPDDVPPELRVDAFFAAQRVREFEHHAVFDGCASVFAVLDAIHPYLEAFFRDSAWVTVSAQSQNVTILKTSGRRDGEGRYAGDSDDDEDDSDDGGSARARAASPSTRRWRLPECIDPAQATEIVLYPGVEPRTFSPSKIINLDPNAPRYGTVGTPTRGNASSQRPMSPSARRYSYGRSSSGFDDSADDQRAPPPKKHIVVLPGALILGGVLDVSEGSIYIGRHVRIEPNVYIKGPCVIGDHSTVRSGAYLRGDLIIGRRVVLRGELKNALVMDNAELCHPGYCGDSLIGYNAHFGNQVTTANLNLFYNTAFNEILVDAGDEPDTRYNTGRKKIGVVLGDYAQLGCSTVTDPCTLVRPNTVVYALTRLSKGIYGPDVIVKNKPLEKGVLEIVPLVTPVAEPPVEAETANAPAES